MPFKYRANGRMRVEREYERTKARKTDRPTDRPRLHVQSGLGADGDFFGKVGEIGSELLDEVVDVSSCEDVIDVLLCEFVFSRHGWRVIAFCDSCNLIACC